MSNNLDLVVQHLQNMRYWSFEKLEREDVFATVGLNSSEEEKAWRRAIDLEKDKRAKKRLRS